jgi:uncharacterized repeat protein (TIGR02543 family)
LGQKSVAAQIGGATVSASGIDANRVLDLQDGFDKTFVYTLKVRVDSKLSGFKETVLIDRLAAPGDTEISGSKARGSEAKTMLKGDGKFTAQVVSIPGRGNPSLAGTPQELTAGAWTVEYRFGTPNEVFTNADWANAPNNTWLSANEVKNQGMDFGAASAFRIRLHPDYIIPPGYELDINCEAVLKDYYEAGKVAWNSFAYSGYAGNMYDIPLTAEPMTVGVKADVPLDQVKITKQLDDPRHACGALRYQSFTFRLDGKHPVLPDYSTEFAITVNRNGDQWVGDHSIASLPRDYIWQLTETTPSSPAFVAGAPTLSSAVIASGMAFDFFIVNTAAAFSITYDKNAANATGVQADGTQYYGGDTVSVLGQGTLQRDGYDFKGWNTTSNGSGVQYDAPIFGNFKISADMTLYAQWNKKADPPTPPNPPNPPNPPDPGTPPNPPTPPNPGRPDPVTPPSGPQRPENPGTSAPAVTAPGLVSPGGAVRTDDPDPEQNPKEPKKTGRSSNTDTLERIKSDGGLVLPIFGAEVPFNGIDYSGDIWALFNLMLAIVGLLIAILTGIQIFLRRRRRDYNNTHEETGTLPEIQSEREKSERENRLVACLVMILFAVAGAVLFFVTENTRLLMVFIDKWTPLQAVLFAVLVVCAALAGRRPQKERFEEDEPPSKRT